MISIVPMIGRNAKAQYVGDFGVYWDVFVVLSSAS